MGGADWQDDRQTFRVTLVPPETAEQRHGQARAPLLGSGLVVRAGWQQAHQVLATGRCAHGPDPVDSERFTDLHEQVVGAQALRPEGVGIMSKMMTVAPTIDQVIEMEAVLCLAPVHAVHREELEDATMEVEQVLDQHALDLTDGASASANFETGCIEIDFVLTGASMGELHQKVALIVTQLDRYCSLRIAPLGTTPPQLAVQGSQTRLRTPDSGPLVPA